LTFPAELPQEIEKSPPIRVDQWALSLSTLKDPLMSAHRDPEDLFAPPGDLRATMQLNFVAPYFVENEIGSRPRGIFTDFWGVL
jgi:hypothetical protein